MTDELTDQQLDNISGGSEIVITKSINPAMFDSASGLSTGKITFEPFSIGKK
jgi:bacteriocin-like protein